MKYVLRSFGSNDKNLVNAISGRVIKLHLLFSLSLIIIFLTNSCALLPKPKFEPKYGDLRLIVSEYNSGPVVEGAIVLLKSTDLYDTKYTDENGIVTFKNLPLNKSYQVRIYKEGYAITTIEVNTLVSSLELNTTLRKARFLRSIVSSSESSETELNQMKVSFKIYSSSEKRKLLMPNSNGIYECGDNSSLYIEATATSTSFPVSFMYVKIGNPPGAEFLTSPRLYNKGNTITGTVDTSYIVGNTYLFIDSYDENDNKYEIIVPLRFSFKFSNIEKPAYRVQRETPAVFAYNLNANMKYYSTYSNYSNNVKDSEKIYNTNISYNTYIELRWKKWEESDQKYVTEKPIGYAIYRSYDGRNFEKIAVVSSDKDFYIDSSSKNKPGTRIWYSISSVYPLFEGATKSLGSVVVLPMLNVRLISPADGAINVELKPTFSWKFEGLEIFDGLVTYLYDIWLYDMNINRKYHYPTILNLERFFKTKEREVTLNFSDYTWTNLPNNELQKNKPYEWSLELVAAEWLDEKNNSYSISILSDYNWKISFVAIPPEKYNLFITKGY